MSRAVEQSLRIIENRVNGTGIAEASIQRQGKDRIVIQLPGVGDPDEVVKMIGQTAKLTFQLVCESQPNSPTDNPPAGLRVLSAEGESAAESVGPDIECRDRRRRRSQRRPIRFRFAQQRADRQLPLQPEGRAALRQAHHRQCRQAIRHRSRPAGHQLSAHQRADSRRLWPDLGQFHGRGGEQPRHRAALGRLAGAIDRGRAAHRRPEPRLRFHSRRRHRLGHRAGRRS